MGVGEIRMPVSLVNTSVSTVSVLDSGVFAFQCSWSVQCATKTQNKVLETYFHLK